MANRFELLLPDIAGSFRQGRADVRQEDRERLADQEMRAQVDRGNRLRDLAGQAHAEQDPAIRQQLMSRAYNADPRGAMQLEDQFASNEERKEALKGNTARLLMSLPQEARAAQYHKMRPTFLQAGMEAPPEYTPEMDQVMKAYAAQQQTGGGVQSTIIGNDGQYYTVDRATGRMTPTGVMAAPNVRVLEQPGQEPYGVVTGRGAAGQVIQLGGGNQPPPMQPHPQSGGPQGSSTVPAPDAGIPPTNPGIQPPAAGPVRIPTPAETAADTARAKAVVELQTAPEIARRTAESTQQGKTQAELQETQRKNKTAFNVYSTGMTNLRQAMAGTDTGPLAGRIPAVTSAQQIAEGAGAAMAPVLKQLFREAGEGTFTEGDQKLLTDMLPKRTDHPEAAKAKLQMIDELVAAKLGQRLGAPPPGGGAEVTATGPNGQKAVLRNGQWILQ